MFSAVPAVSIKLLSYRSNCFLNFNILKQSDMMVHVPQKRIPCNFIPACCPAVWAWDQVYQKTKIKLSQYCWLVKAVSVKPQSCRSNSNILKQCNAMVLVQKEDKMFFVISSLYSVYQTNLSYVVPDLDETYLQPHTKQNLETNQRYFHYMTSDIRETTKPLLFMIF